MKAPVEIEKVVKVQEDLVMHKIARTGVASLLAIMTLLPFVCADADARQGSKRGSQFEDSNSRSSKSKKNRKVKKRHRRATARLSTRNLVVANQNVAAQRKDYINRVKAAVANGSISDYDAQLLLNRSKMF